MAVAAGALLLFSGAWVRAGFVDHFVVPDDVGRNKVPRMGTSRILVIPVIVEDLKKPDLARWKKFFTAREGIGFSPYYKAASLGRFTPEAVMAEPVRYPTCPLPKTWKGCAIPRGDVTALGVGVQFLREILDKAIDGQKLNLKDFDLNGPGGKPDGWVDGIMLMPNGDFPGIALPISNPTLMRYAKLISPTIKVANTPYERDGVKVGAIAISAAFEEDVVPLHEFGHLLGWGDLYHERMYGRGLYFSLMGQYDRGLPFPDAHSRVKAGWANVRQIGKLQTWTLKPGEISGEVLKFGEGKQYFLLENRGPGKVFSTLPPKRGLAVYRVDETQVPRDPELAFIQQIQKCLNCDLWKPLVMNVPRDKSFPVQHGEFWRKRNFEALQFFPGDRLGPDTSGKTLGAGHLSPSTNWPDGTISGLVIRVKKLNPDGSLEVEAGVP